MLYPLHFKKDDNGTLLVTCPVLPEVTTFGDNPAEALEHGTEAVEEAIGARIAAWESVPVPTARELAPARKANAVASTSLLVDMKLRLYLACRDAGVTRAALARRLGWHREQVDRLFRLDHASRIDQIDAAIAAVGRSAELHLLERA